MIQRIQGRSMCIWRVFLVFRTARGKKADQSIENGNPGLYRRHAAAGIRLAEELGPRATVVTMLCDTGMKYLHSYGAKLDKFAART